MTDGWQIYVDSFLARCEELYDEQISHGSVLGSLGSDDRNGAVLALDDGALPFLESHREELKECDVRVRPGAPVCLKLMHELEGMRYESGTAMAVDDVSFVQEPPLPDGLQLRRVRRTAQERVGVPLVEAAEACLVADPGGFPSLDAFVEHLSTAPPPSAKLFAAIDDDGRVRATSGSVTYGRDVFVFFVSTDASWRGRGVGTAMTAHAIRSSGGSRVALDATDAGRGIYSRLGLHDAGRINLFHPD